MMLPYNNDQEYFPANEIPVVQPSSGNPTGYVPPVIESPVAAAIKKATTTTVNDWTKLDALNAAKEQAATSSTIKEAGMSKLQIFLLIGVAFYFLKGQFK